MKIGLFRFVVAAAGLSLLMQMSCIEEAKEDPRKKQLDALSSGDSTGGGSGAGAGGGEDVNTFINTSFHNEAPCATCHENERPGDSHNATDDCVGCHSYPNSWIGPATTFNHATNPAACATCHEKDRPTTATHPAEGECITCHWFPDWIETKL